MSTPTTPFTVPDEDCAPFCVYHAWDECTGTASTTPVLLEEGNPVDSVTVYPTFREEIDLTGVYLAQANGDNVHRGVYLSVEQARALAAALTQAADAAGSLN